MHTLHPWTSAYIALGKHRQCKCDCTWIAGIYVSRLTEQRGAESPVRAASARQSSTSSESTSPQPQTCPAAAAGPSSVSAASDEMSPVSRSSNQPTAAGVANQPRVTAVSAVDAQPQRTGSYHGDFHRRNRLADSPLRAVSIDSARVRPVVINDSQLLII